MGRSSMALARSAPVSVTTENHGGDSTHPMGRARGRATSGSLESVKGGRTSASLGMSRMLSHTR
jgi:hypothetical protein